MIEQPITSSRDDLKLYDYTHEDAPLDVVINVGNSDLMVSAPAAVNDPQRIEVGDRRRGAYYLTLVDRMPGMLQLCKVDPKRLAAVNKKRNIRIGIEDEDWIKEARRRSADADSGIRQNIPYNPHSDMTPLQRAAKGI